MQPTLFEKTTDTIEVKNILLYALGEFQSRGHVLADRELALDRLHGAFVRAGAKFGLPELNDETVANGLRELGAVVKEIPSFFAKRPFRVIVPKGLSMHAAGVYSEHNKKMGSD